MTPQDAIKQLTALGFTFRLDGEAVKVKFIGPGDPDPGQVTPLLALLREHKDEVRRHLSQGQGQAAKLPERVLTCADCGFRKYTGPNPREGWGSCPYRGGCYGLRPACGNFTTAEAGKVNESPTTARLADG